VDRWVPCSRCRQLGPRRGGTRDQPLCATCTRPETTLWRTCPACGAAGRRRTGKCARCTLYARVDLLLTGADGRIRPELQPLRETLRAVQRPRTLQAWLDNDRRAAILQGLAAGLSVSHAALDELPAGKTVDYLRDVLVTVGVLERRDEHMHRLERWTEQLVAARTGEPQQVLRRYANWHVTRRLRARTGGRETTYHQHYTARRTIQAAAGFLDWLTEHQRSLGTLRQDHVDAWLATDPTKDQSRCREAAPFLNWARRQRLTTVRIDSRRWAGPSQPLDNDARWQQARRLLHDQEIDTADRVAGLLVLLYAQRTAAIARLTLEHVTVGEDTVVLHLGAEPIALPDPLGTLAAELVQHRRTHPVTGTRGTRGWLFPGEHPGRPISSKRLNDRLHRLGLRPAKARSTALFQLAADLPAALLARLLGLHISSATGWQRASSGDWTAYAADLINRPPPHFQTP
jgi:hypothetical protein